MITENTINDPYQTWTNQSFLQNFDELSCNARHFIHSAKVSECIAFMALDRLDSIISKLHKWISISLVRCMRSDEMCENKDKKLAHNCGMPFGSSTDNRKDWFSAKILVCRILWRDIPVHFCPSVHTTAVRNRGARAPWQDRKMDNQINWLARFTRF